jgi:protein involved in polysaccharide export with SLBB domain
MRTILQLLLISCALGPTSACAQTQTGAASTPAPQVLGSGFQVGDRILLQVEGDSQFTNTFTVGPGPALTLPVIGEIPLVGVRRADVEPYMSRQLARYLKDPVVHAKALIRVSIVGEVQHPGFYSLPGDAVLADALMQAGGPTREARVPGMTLERGGKPLLQGDSLQLAFARGLTVDDDRFVLPRLTSHDSERTWRIFGIILATVPAVIYAVTRAY